MAPPACESASQAVEESDALLNGLLKTFWGVLGARSPQEGALGEKKAVGKLYGGLLGPSWGPLGAS